MVPVPARSFKERGCVKPIFAALRKVFKFGRSPQQPAQRSGLFIHPCHLCGGTIKLTPIKNRPNMLQFRCSLCATKYGPPMNKNFEKGIEKILARKGPG